MARIHFEDIRAGEVTTFGRVEVTAADIVAFARAWDPQPFHLDEAAGRASLLGGLAASGWHTASLLMRMNCDGWLNESTSLGGPGVDEMRWLKPVRPGDVLTVRHTVLEARPSASKPALGMALFLFEVENQRGETVLTQKNPIFFARRGAPPPRSGLYDTPPPGPEIDAPEPVASADFPLAGEDWVAGRELPLGSYRFERESIVDFARRFDPQPFHLDEAAAAKSPFGRIAASGWHTAAAWMRLMIEAKDRAVAARRARGEALPATGPSPGYRDLKWFKPVYAGDTVRYSMTPLGVRPTSRPGWGIASAANRGVNQFGEPVFAFTSAVFVSLHDATSESRDLPSPGGAPS